MEGDALGKSLGFLDVCNEPISDIQASRSMGGCSQVQQSSRPLPAVQPETGERRVCDLSAKVAHLSNRGLQLCITQRSSIVGD